MSDPPSNVPDPSNTDETIPWEPVPLESPTRQARAAVAPPAHTPSGDAPVAPLTNDSLTFGSLMSWLPSRPASIATGVPSDDLFQLRAGDRIDDFIIDRTLGRGGFGVVYLAHQLSLGRQVALKLVRDSGVSAEGEGRSLAQLEHPNIVHVFSETIDLDAGVRLLCMQYVCGTTLAGIIAGLNERESPRSGASLLAEVSRLDLPAALEEVDAAGQRARLTKADACDLVCTLGEQLANALAHAHQRGVLHRDIKPANVLISRSGRPLLADFNLATRSDDGPSSAIGGTLAYMAPEHLDEFRADASRTTPNNARATSVDHRSDLFSLGVVLWELACGTTPFPIPEGPITRDRLADELATMAEQRRSVRPTGFCGEKTLETVLAHCLSPNPDERPQSAAELSALLAGVRERRQTLRTAPPDPLLAPSTNRPIRWLLLAGAIPQFAASALQIAYNSHRIVDELTPLQQTMFSTIVLVYNLIAVPVCFLWIGRKLWRVATELRRLRREDPEQTDDDVARARRRLLELPKIAAVVACVGWFPGAIVFPFVLTFTGDPVPGEVWGHFAISFVLAGAIAATYTTFATTGVTLRAIYPHFWKDLTHFHKRAAAELVDQPQRVRRVNMLASIVPLAGAIALVLTAPPDPSAVYRGLIVVLIVSGAFGATVVGHLSRRYIEQVYACRGTIDDASTPADVTITIEPTPPSRSEADTSVIPQSE